MEGKPAVDAARHRHRQHAIGRNGGAAEPGHGGPHVLERGAAGGASRGVEPAELAVLRTPHDGEEIAADARPDGFHEPERRVGRDGGVDRRATGLEHVEADLGRERLAGADHAVWREHLGARRKGVAGDAIAREQREGGENGHAAGRGKPMGVHGWAALADGEISGTCGIARASSTANWRTWVSSIATASETR